MNSGREQPRHAFRFRVRSRDLPGFLAITTDLSETGLQLETQGELEVQSSLDLELEFDREDLRDFACPAQVVWSRPEIGSRSRFHVGLSFQPANDDQKTSLARMATVLQARSDSDIETLLEEAKRLDPERAETFERARARGTAPGGPKQVLPMLGIYIPLRVVIEGYAWDRASQTLCVTFVDEQAQHRLYFPHARLLTDYGLSEGTLVTALFSTPHSDTIKKLSKPLAGPLSWSWKHYRFLNEERQPLFELVSAPCQSRPGGTSD